MQYPDIADRLIALARADHKMRQHLIDTGQLSDGYHTEMRNVHLRNADALGRILTDVGYPTPAKVGDEASAAAWLIVQHAIECPSLMRTACALLCIAVESCEAEAVHLAYLSDRIAVYSGEPQQYGTQFDWDAAGMMSPYPVDDVVAVDRRREALGLYPLAEQTQVMRRQAAREKQSPPADWIQRQADFEAWRKRIGWVQEG